MDNRELLWGRVVESANWRRRLYEALACRGYSVIIFGTIFCTLSVKLYWAYSINRLGEYFSWILADLIVLLSIELVLSFVCFLWRQKAVLRIMLVVAAILCT